MVVVESRCRAYDGLERRPSGAIPREPDLRRRIDRMIEAQPVVSLTDAAATKLGELTKEEPNPNVGLRVYVYSGGCSGYRYGMMLEDAPTDADRVLQANGVRVYVDENSIQYLQGSQIDYVDTLMGAGFTVNNPNAVSACGCGSSFRTSDDAGSPRACAHRRPSAARSRRLDRRLHCLRDRAGPAHEATSVGRVMLEVPLFP